MADNPTALEEAVVWFTAASSLVALVISLWSIGISQNTERKSIRRQEFHDKINAPLEQLCQQLDGLCDAVEAQLLTYRSVPDMQADAIDFRSQYVRIKRAISRSLQRASECEFADGGNWLEQVSGFEDGILDNFQDAIKCDNKEQWEIGLNAARASMLEQSISIRRRIDNELSTYIKKAEWGNIFRKSNGAVRKKGR
jgi:hypothetical protein